MQLRSNLCRFARTIDARVVTRRQKPGDTDGDIKAIVVQVDPVVNRAGFAGGYLV
jgi:hypothetical protein